MNSGKLYSGIMASSLNFDRGGGQNIVPYCIDPPLILCRQSFRNNMNDVKVFQ